MSAITVDFTFDMMLDKISNKQRFDFARIGDGEANAIFQDTKSKQNCDQHYYFTDLGKRLLDILKSSPKYFIGLQGLAYRQRTEQIDTITKEHDLKWCKADILHKANIKGRMNEFFEVLKTRNDILLIGPMHLASLAVKNRWTHIVIPNKNCWLNYDMVKDMIIDYEPDKNTIILYCASMMSGVLIDDFAGQCTQIDCGSIFDPYAGINSRSYHKNLKL